MKRERQDCLFGGSELAGIARLSPVSPGGGRAAIRTASPSGRRSMALCSNPTRHSETLSGVGSFARHRLPGPSMGDIHGPSPRPACALGLWLRGDARTSRHCSPPHALGVIPTSQRTGCRLLRVGFVTQLCARLKPAVEGPG